MGKILRKILSINTYSKFYLNLYKLIGGSMLEIKLPKTKWFEC